MKKYQQVQKWVTDLTDDPAFRTFFTLYLMAETAAERTALQARFWQDATTLDEAEFLALRVEFSNCLRRLPALAGRLKERVEESLAVAA